MTQHNCSQPDEPQSDPAVLNVSRDVLDLDKTLNCGQTFLWDLDPVEHCWYGFIHWQAVKVFQTDTQLTVIGNVSPESIQYYFDLTELYTFTCLSPFEQQCVAAGQGIRILRQPFLECLVTFLISQNNNMNRIRQSLSKLCTSYGVAHRIGNRVQHSFPTADRLSQLTISDWKQLGVGYRAKYLYSFFQQHSSGSISLLRYLMGGSNDLLEDLKILQKIHGVGPKVAHCIALFCYHHLNAFPVDTHIMKILQEHRDITLPRPDGLDGLMQQYMFYYDAFSKTEDS